MSMQCRTLLLWRPDQLEQRPGQFFLASYLMCLGCSVASLLQAAGVWLAAAVALRWQPWKPQLLVCCGHFGCDDHAQQQRPVQVMLVQQWQGWGSACALNHHHRCMLCWTVNIIFVKPFAAGGRDRTAASAGAAAGGDTGACRACAPAELFCAFILAWHGLHTGYATLQTSHCLLGLVPA